MIGRVNLERQSVAKFVAVLAELPGLAYNVVDREAGSGAWVDGGVTH